MHMIMTGPTNYQGSDLLYYLVDARTAGPGSIVVEVAGQKTTPYAEVKGQGGGRYKTTFTPVEEGQHSINVMFHGERVPGE